MNIETIKWLGDEDGCLEIIDQRYLPSKFRKLKCHDIDHLCHAIKTLAVRGAPAIGVAAAYGVCLAMQKLGNRETAAKTSRHILKACKQLVSTRPTAVNLSWALERIQKTAFESLNSKPRPNARSVKRLILEEAHAIYREDARMCRKIGQNGQKFIKSSMGILTHCNAGALATAGCGTALSVIYEAKNKGKKFNVYVDETRPLLQGARLTAWELKQAEIHTTLICDNMAGWLIRQKKIHAVITGADRIAANGDTANKIGTYSLSVLARFHNIPFYIAAPSSTFDLNIPSGQYIDIEQREACEVTIFAQTKIAPDGIFVYNPAFDVTPAENISAIITEKGVIEKPDKEKIAQHLAGSV